MKEEIERLRSEVGLIIQILENRLEKIEKRQTEQDNLIREILTMLRELLPPAEVVFKFPVRFQFLSSKSLLRASIASLYASKYVLS